MTGEEPDVTLGRTTLDDLLDAIAAKTPTPGGGAVAALAGAIAAALGGMVIAYSKGRKALAGQEELHREAAATLADHRVRALALAEADARAYARLNALWRLPEEDPKRRAEWDAAVAAAIDAPSRAIDLALETLDLLERLPGRTNAMLASDVAVAAVMAEAAARGAAWNVRINLPSVHDAARRAAIERRTAERLACAGSRRSAIETACAPASPE